MIKLFSDCKAQETCSLLIRNVESSLQMEVLPGLGMISIINYRQTIKISKIPLRILIRIRPISTHQHGLTSMEKNKQRLGG